ncbi:MAG: FtsH protease activity modulator HflK [Rhizomicrobium sp.]
MPWNNQSGSDGNGQGPQRGPWGRGTGSGGSGGGQPPDLEELLRRSQDRLRRLIPGGFGFTAGSIAIVALGLIVVWLASGIYIVTQSEQGVVLRFGALVARTGPGLNYHLPWPIESVQKVEVTTSNQIDIGYKSASDSDSGATDDSSRSSSVEDIPQESLMLTGDENIVDVNFTIYWVIKDASAFLFNVEDPEATIKAVGESAMREVVGQSQVEPIITQDPRLAANVRELMQKTLDRYGAGVTITSVKLQNAQAPPEVTEAYRDVQKAIADQETARNAAEAYANKVIPEARGNASVIVNKAQAYRLKTIAEAEGEAQRFTLVYNEYRKAPEITRRRMYLETMSQVLAPANKIILDDTAGRNVVPYLPLPALDKNRTENVTVAAPSSTASPSVSAAPGASQ